MDTFLLYLNAGVFVAVAAICGWLVMWRHFRDGIALKTGLILLCLGASGIAHSLIVEGPTLPPPVVLTRALAMIDLGVLVIVGTLAWRIRRRPDLRRQASDWMGLDTEKNGHG